MVKKILKWFHFVTAKELTLRMTIHKGTIRRAMSDMRCKVEKTRSDKEGDIVNG